MDRPLAIILAAGKSTRMKSDLPKVLHEVCGRPMIEYVLDASRSAGVARMVVVVGHKAELVRQAVESHADVEFALQSEQHGTGHAVMMCEQALAAHDGPVLIVAGDTPLLRGGSLSRLLEVQKNERAACVIGTAVTEANQGLGRIVRDAGGNFMKIVEQKDATPAEAAITEINTGCYAFDSRSLVESLRKVRPDNVQAEYYLTDCPAILQREGKRVVASAEFTITEALGVNTRAQLAEVQAAIQHELQQRLMVEGVSIVSPSQTYIDPRAVIGGETVIYPFTWIGGAVTIGRNCRLGPHAVIREGARIPDGTVVPPFSSLPR